MKHTRFYRAKHQLAEVRTELVGQAITLLREWADPRNPELETLLQRSRACADALEAELKRRGLRWPV